MRFDSAAAVLWRNCCWSGGRGAPLGEGFHRRKRYGVGAQEL